MFIAITNTPRDYAWGSSTAIADLLGHTASGGPEAELWFGAHPGSPSRIVDPSLTGGAETLDAWIDAEPKAALGSNRTKLPFLLKVLAADRPLSLQAHPNPAQAREGFIREQTANVPIDADERNYRDDSAKPELIFAISDTFEALVGFRHVSESRLLLAELSGAASGEERAAVDLLSTKLSEGVDPGAANSFGSSWDVAEKNPPAKAETLPAYDGGSANPLREALAWLLGGGDDVERIIRAVIATAPNLARSSSFAREWATIARLAEEYPTDPAVVISLLLNRVSLRAGQAMFLPAGDLHSYLSGVGIEIMSASDNVLRGGFTTKHVDRAELLDVVLFEAQAAPIVQPDSPVAGIQVFRTDADEFVLAEVTLGEAGYDHGYRLSGPQETAFALTGPAIALVTDGGVAIRGRHGETSLAHGDAVFITPDEGELTFTGSGSVFVATTP